jgi:hypothetical protein
VLDTELRCRVDFEFVIVNCMLSYVMEKASRKMLEIIERQAEAVRFSMRSHDLRDTDVFLAQHRF